MPSTFSLKLQSYFWVLKLKLYSTLVRTNFLEKNRNVWKGSTSGLIFPSHFDSFSAAGTSGVTVDSAQPTQKFSKSKSLRTVGLSYWFPQPSPGLPVGLPHSSVVPGKSQVLFLPVEPTCPSLQQPAQGKQSAHPFLPIYSPGRDPAGSHTCGTSTEYKHSKSSLEWTCHKCGLCVYKDMFYERVLEIEFPDTKSVLVASLVNPHGPGNTFQSHE